MSRDWAPRLPLVPSCPSRHGLIALAAWATISPARIANATPGSPQAVPSDITIAPEANTNTPSGDDRSESVELSWARSPEADSCLSGTDLKNAVRARLGRNPFSEPFHKQIDGYVSHNGGKWTADLVVRDEQRRVGNRRLESTTTDCRELDQAVVLTVTLIVDPNATLKPEHPTETVAAPLKTKPPESAKPAALAPPIEPSPTANTPPEAAPPRQAPTPSTFAPEPADPLSTRLLLAPSVSYKLLPGITPAIALRAEVPLGQRVQLEGTVAYFPEGRFRTSSTDVGYNMTALAAGSCYHPNRSFALLACGSAWLGALSSVVYAGVPDAPGPRVWASLRTDVGASAQSDRLLVELRLFGMFPLSRWNFQIDGEKTQFKQPFVAPGIEIGVGVQLP